MGEFFMAFAAYGKEGGDLGDFVDWEGGGVVGTSAWVNIFEWEQEKIKPSNHKNIHNPHVSVPKNYIREKWKLRPSDKNQKVENSSQSPLSSWLITTRCMEWIGQNHYRRDSLHLYPSPVSKSLIFGY